MPFTLAHPLIPVLLKRVMPGLSLTAMAAGSVIPDMENFFRMHDADSLGHKLPGILFFDIPAGLILCFLFHHFLRIPLVANLPLRFQKRFTLFTGADWTRYVWQNKLRVLVSLLIGILTHFGWDAFTHQDGFFVEQLPFLTLKIRLFATAYPLHFILQLISSIAGMSLLYRYIMRLPVQAEKYNSAKPGWYYWGIFVFIFFLLLITRLYVWPEMNSYLNLWRAGMGSFLYAWIIVSLIFFKPAVSPGEVYR